MQKTRILLKLSGETLVSPQSKTASTNTIIAIIDDIKTLRDSHNFALVIGGGNFFRGSQL